MKLFGFRLRSWLFFGLGFLAGSAAGEGPFKRVMEMVDQFRGGGGAEFRANMRHSVNDMKEAVTSRSN